MIEYLVVDFEILLPCAHDKGVVDGNAGDGVDTFGLELGGFLNESREVLLGASGSERAGDGKEDGFLSLGQVGDGGCLEFTFGVEIR